MNRRKKSKPQIDIVIRRVAEYLPWRCGHPGCTQWGALFKHPHGTWLGRPPETGDVVRRCHFHSGLFQGPGSVEERGRVA